MDLHAAADKIGRAESLDRPAGPTTSAIKRVIRRGVVKDALSGTWLGHPLHPLLTDIPIGAWFSAMALDVLGGGGGEQAAARLIGIGILSAAPTVASGLSDWSDFLGGERRVGFVHAVANAVALALFSSSYVARRRGSRRAGKFLGLLGGAAMSAGGYLG